jgi:hypothetical protein
MVLFDADPAAGDWIISDQNFYTDEDKKIVQYTATLTLNFEVGNKNFDINTLDDNIFFAPTTGPDNSLADEFGGSLTVFAFSSWYDTSSPELFGYYAGSSQQPFPVKRITVSDDYRDMQTSYIDLMPPLARQQVSDISYQKVFKDGNAYTDPEVLFADAAGIVYNHTPILSINGKYYKQDGYTLEQIVEDFSSLISAAAILDEPTTQLESILNDLASTLEIYGESSELLIRLNLIRIAFPEKSTATEVGRFYELVKTRFFNAAQGVASGTQVFEQLVHTSKVRDLRAFLEGTYSPSFQEEVPVIYGRNRGFEEGLVTSLKLWEYGADGIADPYVLIRNGFWFFDPDAAVKNYSLIGRIFNIEALKAKFGMDIITRDFLVTEARTRKWTFTGPGWFSSGVGRKSLEEWISENPDGTKISDDDLKWVADIKSRIEYVDDPYSGASKYTPRTTATGLEVGTDPNTSEQTTLKDVSMKSGENTTETYLSYLFLRGVDALADSELDSSYGLMTFQFQDVESKWSESSNRQSDEDTLYSFEVDVEDSSKATIQALTASFIDIFNNELQTYYDFANENCSYNNADGKFNSFFTEGVMNNYSNLDKTDTPWVQAAATFIAFRDLTTHAYNGSEEEMAKAGQAIVGKINPVNGNLEDLTTFYNNYKAFADLYLPGGDIYEIVDAAPETILIQFGQEGASFGDGEVVQYFPLPNPVVITTDALPEFSNECNTICPAPNSVGQYFILEESTCVCIPDPDPPVTRHKIGWNEDGYKRVGNRTERLSDFIERMKGIYEDILDGCETCPGGRSGQKAHRSLEWEQVWVATSDYAMEKNWGDYREDVRSEMAAGVEDEAYKDAVYKWCKWAWQNCDLATEGRHATGVNWKHYIKNVWGYGWKNKDE